MNSLNNSLLSHDKTPLVSVVITTKNEEANIANCISSLLNQSYKNLEIIVVDNYSKDKTTDIASSLGAKILYKGNERSAQRNHGAQIAIGQHLIYLDADMILSPHLIEECVKKIESDDIVAIYIPEKVVGKGFWIKVRDFERSFYTGTVIDAVRFIRRDVFLHVGGFDESLIGPEDWDFDRKIRGLGQTAICSLPLYHNEGEFKMRRYLKKKGYYTNGVTEYVNKWGSNDSEVSKQVGFRYRLFGVFVEKGKWKKLVKHPLLTFAMYILRLRVALVYFRGKNT